MNNSLLDGSTISKPFNVGNNEANSITLRGINYTTQIPINSYPIFETEL